MNHGTIEAANYVAIPNQHKLAWLIQLYSAAEYIKSLRLVYSKVGVLADNNHNSHSGQFHLCFCWPVSDAEYMDNKPKYATLLSQPANL